MLGAASVLLVLIMLSRQARDRLRPEDRYQMAFTAIECVPPQDQDRLDFLAEVQYLANLPDNLPLLDAHLCERLAEGFARHPWVERVEEVRLEASRVEVRLRYRTAVLAVKTAGRLRAVESHGVLLPVSARTDELPLFPATAAPPAGPAGTPWGDPQVESAARAASH
jgi:hypothetical protein